MKARVRSIEETLLYMINVVEMEKAEFRRSGWGRSGTVGRRGGLFHESL